VIGERRFRVPIEPSNVDPKAKLAELEARGLEGAAICASPMLFYYDLELELAEAMCRATNTGLAEFVAAHPDRFRWLAHAPFGHPERVVDVIRDAAAAGAVGVEAGTLIAGRRLDDPVYEPFWAAMEELGLPVFVHPFGGTPYNGLADYYLPNVIGNPLETTIVAERLIAGRALDRHPTARVLLAHGGGFFPFNAGRLRHARTVRPELAGAPEEPLDYAGRLLVDTVLFDAETIRFVVSKLGERNVVVGTDLPFDMSPRAAYAELEQAVGVRAARVIAEENPAALFRFA
jgi:aminocarboxymuconate-semialdehyde decarboxylase